MQERRFSTRVKVPYHARLSGVDTTGRVFKEETVLDDLSVGGVHMRLQRSMPIGANVTVSVRLSMAPETETPSLRLAARGTVRRLEPESDGRFGVAVEFTRRRIL
ncbi:MAG: hypothetical protein DMG13_33350 [Acidobacteria bacterium]|nr:MAG: hypothetical protein DMG13_33350 [Acidobacteriota bacterium]